MCDEHAGRDVETHYRVFCTGNDMWPGDVGRQYFTGRSLYGRVFFPILVSNGLIGIGSANRSDPYSRLFGQLVVCLCRILGERLCTNRRRRVSECLRAVVCRPNWTDRLNRNARTSVWIRSSHTFAEKGTRIVDSWTVLRRFFLVELRNERPVTDTRHLFVAIFDSIEPNTLDGYV